MYAIRVQISPREHEEDQEVMRQQILSGHRAVTNFDGEWLTAQEYSSLCRKDQDEIADAELGADWDSLWLYPDGSAGLDPEPRAVWDTYTEAEKVAESERMNSDSTYEVVEIWA